MPDYLKRTAPLVQTIIQPVRMNAIWKRARLREVEKEFKRLAEAPIIYSRDFADLCSSGNRACAIEVAGKLLETREWRADEQRATVLLSFLENIVVNRLDRSWEKEARRMAQRAGQQIPNQQLREWAGRIADAE